MTKRGGLPVNAQQEAVVDHVLNSSVTVVAAGAGSGKTHTTIAAVVELIVQKRASAEQFVLITFTNKAANELRDRIRGSLRECLETAEMAERAFWRSQIERLGVAYLGTIHGYCSQLLRRYGYEQAVARQAEVTFSTRLRREALTDALEAYDQKPRLFGTPKHLRPFEIGKLAGAIYDAMRNQGIEPGHVLAQTQMQQLDGGKPVRVGMARLVADFHDRYCAAKSEVHAVDAHDLLEATARMLEAEPAVAEQVGRRLRYLFIDEFQDTDHIQKRLVDCLIPHTEGVLVVGDNKQSIYAFRGADVSLLDQLAADNGVEVLPISISRRPTLPLLRAQNGLLRSLGRRFSRLDAPLSPHPGALMPDPAPTPFMLLSHGDRSTPRVPFVVRVVRRMLDEPVDFGPSEGVRPVEHGDIVLLARTNKAVQSYTQGLNDAGIPARADRGARFYEAPEIVAVYRLLRLVLHYPNDGVVSQALDTPYLAGLGGRAVERGLVQYRPAEGAPLVDWLEENHEDLANRLSELRARVRTDTVSQLLRRVYAELGVTKHHEQAGDAAALLNLERLRDIARNTTDNEQGLSLRQFVDFLRVAIQEGYQEDFADPPSNDQARPPYVRLMTIHRAKGLEFPFIVIPDARDPLVGGTPPKFLLHEHLGLDVQASPVRTTTSARFDEELIRGRARQLQEGMRLLYVAVTRATHAVVMVGYGGLEIGPDRWRSWQDEVLEARPDLEAAGGVFRSVR